MSRHFFDLSATLCNDDVSNPPFMRRRTEYEKRHDKMTKMGTFFPRVSAEAETLRIEHDWRPLDIVLVDTATGKTMGDGRCLVNLGRTHDGP